MAFPTGWNRKCSLVIQASEINSDLTDFPVLLTEDTLPLEMFDADGSYTALSGGGDIRFSSDSAGNTRFACEVVTFTTDNDPANGKAEIWVKVPSISSSINTTIYVWYNAAGETQPVSDDAYGSENVWNSNFKGVWHLGKDPSGTAPQESDSTTNNNNGTSGGSMISDDLVDGKIGKALDFDGSDDDVKVASNGLIGNEANLTVEVWINWNGGSGERAIYNEGQSSGTTFRLRIVDGTLSFGFSVNGTWQHATSPDAVPQNEWHCIVGILSSSAGMKIYVDGVEKGTNSNTSSCNASLTVSTIGRYGQDGYNFPGIIDEVHIFNVANSVDWIKAEYNNQNDPSTFVIEGTPKYGIYYFSGYVFEQNNPVSRKLYLHNISTGALVGTTTSSGNGYYCMETSFSGSHYIVCLDDAAGIDYNDLIIGPAFPTTVSGIVRYNFYFGTSRYINFNFYFGIRLVVKSTATPGYTINSINVENINGEDILYVNTTSGIVREFSLTCSGIIGNSNVVDSDSDYESGNCGSEIIWEGVANKVIKLSTESGIVDTFFLDGNVNCLSYYVY